MDFIKEGKNFFKDDAGKAFVTGDGVSEKAQEINLKFRKAIEGVLEGTHNIELNILGSKWSVQGQRKIRDGIWYRAYYQPFGQHFPLVLGFYLDAAGVNVAVQIYNNKLNSDAVLSKKLGDLFFSVYVELGKPSNLSECTRDNKNEPYKDLGYFKINDLADFKKKSEEVIDVYLSVVKKLNKKIFNDMLKEYIELVESETDSRHCQTSPDNEFYKNRLGIKEKVNIFIEEPNRENFKKFWNKGMINSVQQAANATNVLDRNGSEKELGGKIKELISFEPGTAKESEIIEKVESSKMSSMELYYYYHMDDSRFPLVNGGVKNALKLIEKAGIEVDGLDVIEKLQQLQEHFAKCETGIKDSFLVDQFLNLLDKIKYEEIQAFKNKEAEKELYVLAYLFTYWQKVHKTNSKDEFNSFLKKSKNIIFYGAPGTGKTYTTRENILQIIDDNPIGEFNNLERFKTVQFHPSYSYEDFIEGLKPVIKDKGVELKLCKGHFSKFCDAAKEFEEDYEKERSLKYAFFFLVDEINRAELSRVFGELMYCLENRGKSGIIESQYSYLRDETEESFYIPSNIFFIGTMNDVDRSIDSFDMALRRRFLWHRMDCDYEVIKNNLPLMKDEWIGGFGGKGVPESGYIKACYDLNDFIINTHDNGMGMGKIFEIGHSYFLNIERYSKKGKPTNSNLADLFDDSIAPLLKEYIRSELPENQLDKKVADAKKKFSLPKSK